MVDDLRDRVHLLRERIQTYAYRALDADATGLAHVIDDARSGYDLAGGFVGVLELLDKRAGGRDPERTVELALAILEAFAASDRRRAGANQLVATIRAGRFQWPDPEAVRERDLARGLAAQPPAPVLRVVPPRKKR